MGRGVPEGLVGGRFPGAAAPEFACRPIPVEGREEGKKERKRNSLSLEKVKAVIWGGVAMGGEAGKRSGVAEGQGAGLP